MKTRFSSRKLLMVVAVIAAMLGAARLFLRLSPVLVIESSCPNCDIYLDEVYLGRNKVSITVIDALRLGISTRPPEKSDWPPAYDSSLYGVYFYSSRRADGSVPLLHLRASPGSRLEGDPLWFDGDPRRGILILDKVSVGNAPGPLSLTHPKYFPLSPRQRSVLPMFTFRENTAGKTVIDVELPADFIAARDRDGLDIRVGVNAQRFSNGSYVHSNWHIIQRDANTGREFIELDVPRSASDDQVLFFANVLSVDGRPIKGFEELSDPQQVLSKSEYFQRVAAVGQQASRKRRAPLLACPALQKGE